MTQKGGHHKGESDRVREGKGVREEGVVTRQRERMTFLSELGLPGCSGPTDRKEGSKMRE